MGFSSADCRQTQFLQMIARENAKSPKDGDLNVMSKNLVYTWRLALVNMHLDMERYSPKYAYNETSYNGHCEKRQLPSTGHTLVLLNLFRENNITLSLQKKEFETKAFPPLFLIIIII